jgi:hypothetical protein
MPCIESMQEDIREQVLTRSECKPRFAFQIDESTYVAGLAQLLVFVRSVLEKTSGKSSCCVYRFQKDVQGVIYSRH